MGKRIDQLKVDDTPIAETPSEPIDPRGTAWYRFVVEIEDLLATGQYTWAEPTLRDIQLTVEATHQVTPGQRRAIGNIEAGRYKSRGRRYEGFSRRPR
jgi:hypothetical protein